MSINLTISSIKGTKYSFSLYSMIITSLAGKNGWADMFTAYRGAGVPTTAEPGCATGTVMSGSSGTFTCTFGTESTSNASSPYRILIRWRLDVGDSITAMSYTTT